MNWSPFEGTVQTSQDRRLGHCCSFALAMSLKTSLRGAFTRRPWERLLSHGGGFSCPFRNQTPVPSGCREAWGRFSLDLPKAQASHALCLQERDQAVLPQHQLPSPLLLVALRGNVILGQPELQKHLPQERPFREVQPPPCLLTCSLCPVEVEGVLTQ